MQEFKFLSLNKNRQRRRNGHTRPTFNSFSYPDMYAMGNEMNYVFIWSINDRRPNEFRMAIYQGYIKDFGRSYDNEVIENDEILFLFPTIESISNMWNFTNIPVGENYQFTDPDELVTIFYKIYKI